MLHYISIHFITATACLISCFSIHFNSFHFNLYFMSCFSNHFITATACFHSCFLIHFNSFHFIPLHFISIHTLFHVFQFISLLLLHAYNISIHYIIATACFISCFPIHFTAGPLCRLAGRPAGQDPPPPRGPSPGPTGLPAPILSPHNFWAGL